MRTESNNLQGQRLHETIVQRFHAMIQAGALVHGAKLPAERALAEQFKVGRSSVREAIRTLELQGLVVSKHGSGTFINTQSLEAVATLMTCNRGAGDPSAAEECEVANESTPVSDGPVAFNE